MAFISDAPISPPPEPKFGIIEQSTGPSDHLEEKTIASENSTVPREDTAVVTRHVFEQIREQHDRPLPDSFPHHATLQPSAPTSGQGTKNAVTIFKKTFPSRSIASQAWNLLGSNQPHKVLQSITQAFSKLKILAKTSDSTKNPPSTPLSSPTPQSVKDESIYLDQNRLLKGEQGEVKWED